MHKRKSWSCLQIIVYILSLIIYVLVFLLHICSYVRDDVDNDNIKCHNNTILNKQENVMVVIHMREFLKFKLYLEPRGKNEGTWEGNAGFYYVLYNLMRIFIYLHTHTLYKNHFVNLHHTSTFGVSDVIRLNYPS